MIRKHLSFANVTAVLALFIALGGASYAATQLPKNSVGTKQIKKNAVNSAKVRDGSLRAGDFKAGQLPEGPQGPKGDPGIQGEKGPKGDPGLSGIERVYVSTGAVNSDSPKSAVAECAPGKVAIGAGYDMTGGKSPNTSPNGLTNVVADVVEPTGPGTIPGKVYVEAWEEEAISENWGVSAIAICASPTP